MIIRASFRVRCLFACVLGFSPFILAANAQTTLRPCSHEAENLFAVVQDDSLLRAGVSAFENNHFDDAVSILKRVTRNRASEAEAYFWLARLQMDERVNEPAAASRNLRKALDLEPENILFIEERLTQLNSGNSFFFGSDADRQWWAARILEIDSTNAAAYANIGMDSMDQYYSYRALLGTNFNERLVRMTDEARIRARGNLEYALTRDPCRRKVYDALIEFHFDHRDFEPAVMLTSLMQKAYPSEAATWLYSGVSNYFLGRLDEADQQFGAAFAHMTTAEEQSFAQHAFFLTDDEHLKSETDPRFLHDYWAANRARYMTEVNERLLAHYARLVYSDLIFPYWREYAADEWLTTPGEMIIRYGLPTREYSRYGYRQYFAENKLMGGNTGAPVATNRYKTFVFRGRSFRFTDEFRNGQYFLRDGADARAEIYRTPQTYSYEGPARKVDIPYLVTVFQSEAIFASTRSSSTEADIYISIGIPLRASGTDTTTFASVLDTSNHTSLDALFLTVGSFLIDPAGTVITRKKQTLYGLPQNGVLNTAGGSLWTTTHKLSADPAEYRISVEFETFSKDALGATPGRVTVRAIDSDSLGLSDILLAYSVDDEGPGLAAPSHFIRRNNLVIEPAPWAVYSPSQPIFIYFEMYGLNQHSGGQTELEVEIALVPDTETGGIGGFIDRIMGGEDVGGIAVRTNYAGSSPNDFQYFIVDASEQSGGQYNLVVRIRDLVSGTIRQTQRTVFLEDK